VSPIKDLSSNNSIFSSRRNFWKNLKRRKEKNEHVLQDNVEILTLFKKRIIVFSLKYAARSQKNCCVLKILYECLMMFQHESKQVTIQTDILLETELCLPDVAYRYFA